MLVYLFSASYSLCCIIYFKACRTATLFVFFTWILALSQLVLKPCRGVPPRTPLCVLTGHAAPAVSLSEVSFFGVPISYSDSQFLWIAETVLSAHRGIIFYFSTYLRKSGRTGSQSQEIIVSRELSGLFGCCVCFRWLCLVWRKTSSAKQYLWCVSRKAWLASCDHTYVSDAFIHLYT